jgi:hypothetical protein
MSSKPTDLTPIIFNARNALGILAAPDATPTAVLYHNGALDASVTVTIAALTTTRFSASLTIPSTYAAGDSLQVVVTYSVGGAQDELPLPIYVLDARRIGDISTASGAVVGSYASGEDPATITGVTAARAALLDNLDATVSSRLALSAYTAPDNADIASIEEATSKIGFDSSGNVKSAPQTGVTVAGYASGEDPATLTGVTAARAALLDNLDATVSSRLALSAYTAPDNANIAAALADLISLLARTDPTSALSAIQVSISALKSLVISTYAENIDDDGTTIRLPIDETTNYPLLSMAAGQNNKRLIWATNEDFSGANTFFVKIIHESDSVEIGTFKASPVFNVINKKWFFVFSVWPSTSEMSGRYVIIGYATLSSLKTFATPPVLLRIDA